MSEIVKSEFHHLDDDRETMLELDERVSVSFRTDVPAPMRECVRNE